MTRQEPLTLKLIEALLPNASVVIECDDPEAVCDIYLEAGKLTANEILADALKAGAKIYVDTRRESDVNSGERRQLGKCEENGESL